jgi:hypothetical protein
MKPDQLQIRFRIVGGMFIDGPGKHGVCSIWGCYIHNPATDTNFLLATGTPEEAAKGTIERLQSVIDHLNSKIKTGMCG